jgi:alpha-L-fucosidase
MLMVRSYPYHIYALNRGLPGSGPDQANDGNLWSTWYSPHGAKDAWLEIVFKEPMSFNRVMIIEPIGRWGDYQRTRIGRYWWQVLIGEKWVTLVDVPYKDGSSHPAILSHWVKRTIATRVRFWFDVVEDTAHINIIGIYDEPERTQ